MTSRTQVLSFQHVLACFALVFGCFAVGVCAVCSEASAQAQASSNAATGSEAYKQLIEQALSEFKHKNWPEARILFRRAHELSPSARTLRGMGVVSYEMRDYVQAVRDLSAALVDPRQPLNAEQRGEAETLLARARTFVGVYRVTVEPAEATLALDGAPAVRETDGTYLVAFGEHVLSATANGYEAGRTQVTVQGGENGEVSLALVPVFIEPRVAPTAASEPSSARELSEPSPEPTATENEDKGGLRFTWVTLGASALFGGASAAFWLLGAQKLDELDASCKTAAAEGDPCRSGKTNTDDVARYELLTNISLGFTGAALVATGVLAIVEWPRRSERRVAVGLGPSSLSVRGAF